MYALTCDVNDAWGVSSYLRAAGFESAVQWARGPLLIAALLAFLKIWKAHKRGEVSRRVWTVARVLAGCQLWIALGEVLKGEPFQTLASYVIYTGLPMALIALAYCRERKAQVLFALAVTIQLSLSFLIVVFPQSRFGVFNGRNYAMADPELLGTQDWYEGGLARVGDQQRVFAQHYNPQAYGLYALVGVIVGSLLLLSSKAKWSRIAGGVLLSLGCFGWTVTVPRGATAGFLLSVGVIVWRSLKRTRRFVPITLTLATLGVSVVMLFVVPIPWAELVAAFEITDQDTVVRMDAAHHAVDQVIAFPWFGVPAEVFNAEKVGVHQLMGYFAVVHGLPVGCAVAWLMGIAVWAHRSAHIERKYDDGTPQDCGGMSVAEKNTSLLAAGVILGLGLTNNFAASMLFWTAWTLSCVPWLFAKREGHIHAYGRALANRAAGRSSRERC